MLVPESWYIFEVQPNPPHEPFDVPLHSILTCWEKSCVMQVILHDLPIIAGKHGTNTIPNLSKKKTRPYFEMFV